MAKFSSNFWGPDFCSTHGFDALVKRLKEGKRMCIDFEEYLEKRAKIEKEYGESLIRLAKNSAGKDEIGTLRKSWDQLKVETENMGKTHLSLAHKVLEEIHHSLKEFREQQRDYRRKSEDTVKRAAQHKRQCYNRNNTLKTKYENHCKAADNAEETSNRLHSNPQTKAKDLTQAAKKMESSRASANHADQQYQESVRNLEDARQLWEREMEVLCKQFQELEEQRIAFIRHQLWTLANLYSQGTVEIDESCETIRKSLEECDVDADIDLFVRDRATGSERPQQIHYINFYHPDPPDTLGGSGVRSGPLAGGHPPPPQKELPPLPPEPSQEAPGSDMVYSSIPETLNVDHTQLVQEGYYAAPRPVDKVIALYDYEAQGDQELYLEEGDIVTVVAQEDEVWWCGQCKGKTGMFPSTYVEPYTETGT